MSTRQKKTLNMIALTTSKANAQNLTCFATFIVTAILAVVVMLVAIILPAKAENVTEIICWISMCLEAISAILGIVASWIKRNAL